MGCDWASGVACYGHSMRCSQGVSFERITCPNVDTSLCNTKEAYITREGCEYVVACWKLFCAKYIVHTNVECVFMCDELPCSHDSVYYTNKSRFVFGNKIEARTAVDLVGKLPDDLPLHVAHFFYLFNLTDTFSNVWNKNGKPRKNVKITLDIVQPGLAFDNIKSNISSADFFVGCI